MRVGANWTRYASSAAESKHKNDIYGDVDNPKAAKDKPATPAATVVLLPTATRAQRC